jgi:radical SAM superfamily enzyme
MICKNSDLGFRVSMIKIIKLKGLKGIKMEKIYKNKELRNLKKHIFF